MIPEKFIEDITKCLQGEHDRGGGFCWVNEMESTKIHDDVYSLSFTSMYPNIMLNIYDDIGGLSEFTSDIEEQRKIIERGRNISQDERIRKNAFFGNLANPYSKYNRYTPSPTGVYFAHAIMIYGLLVCEDILENHRGNILHIDTDTIHYIKPIDFCDYGIPYEIERVSRCVFYEKKRYITYSGSDFRSRGMKGEYWGHVDENVRRRILRSVRSEKINSVLKSI